MIADASATKIGLLAFTGRFQPFHVDHLAMARLAFDRAFRVVFGVTNPDPTEHAAHPASPHRHLASANPFSYAQRASLIAASLRADGIVESRFCILPFPLDEPARWPGLLPPGTPQLVRVFSEWEREKSRRFAAAGYPPVILQGDLGSRISATDIRRCLHSGEPWQHWVPPGARELLREWVRWEAPTRRRSGICANGG